MGLVDKILGVDNQPKGYYEMHKNHYQPPPEVRTTPYQTITPSLLSLSQVERLVVAREAQCYRVTKLNARTMAGWLGCTLGVVGAGFTVFSLVALWKKDAKFEHEIAAPVRAYFKKQL